jgi:pyruvate/2-oxoglutarate/acetoin dehydrogenase E1 component
MKGLLKAAVRDPDPVVVIESLAVWGMTGEVPDGDHVVPIGEAAVARAGEDVTLVSWGSAVPRTLAGAELLHAEHGIAAEVLDLRTISPLDTAAILRSLEKTGRIVIVHDAVGPFGGGAEVAAVAASEGFHALRAPIRRVTAPFAPVPLPAHLEEAYYPQAADVAAAVLEVVG